MAATFSMSALRLALPATQLRPARRATLRAEVPTFHGLSTTGRLPFDGAPGSSLLVAPDNGSKWFAMRHAKRVPKLNRPADQRKALVRGLVTEVLRHGKIVTTKTRAKAIRKYVDKMIGLAKDGTLHARRQALGFVYDKDIVRSLFAEAPKRYGERNGGYCRVVTETRTRRGDNAEMAVIELV